MGVSTDSKESQKAFRETQRLPYLLVADPKGEVLKAFAQDVLEVIKTWE